MTRQPLSPEERALADKLARTAPRAEPSAALDAKILAMAAEAHAAPAATPETPRRKPRWLPPLALAASLALVAGVIWRVHPVLNPEPPPQAAISEADVAASEPLQAEPVAAADAAMPEPEAAAVSETAAASQIAEPAAALANMPAPVVKPPQNPPPAVAAPAPPPVAVAEAPVQAKEYARQKTQTSENAKPAAAMAARPALRSAEIADIPAYAPPPPAPAASPAPPAPAAAARMSAPVTAERAEPLESIQVTGTRIQPGDMEIAHIRELMEQGNTRKARRELKKLLRRHPELEVPDDLKPLLD